MQTFQDTHWNVVVHVLIYLKTYLDKGLFFSAENNFSLIGCADLDWVSYTDTRCPVTSYCVFLGNSLTS